MRPGRSIFLIRPTISKPLAKRAPVLPADSKASAWPSLTACAANTMEAFFFLRIARTGSSSPLIFSGVWMISTRSVASKYGRILSWSPNKSTSMLSKAAMARFTPFTADSGAKSPPMASTAILIIPCLPPYKLIISINIWQSLYQFSCFHHNKSLPSRQPRSESGSLARPQSLASDSID